ncbi:MAG TPA: helix-turn-helix domain-containing protein, partial [Prolixibacteraceae bacterium]
MNNEFVRRLTDIVEANLANENFGVEDLVSKMGISHTNLHRKLKTISNQTISQFIREIRLKKAKELLLNDDLTVSEVSYRVGFGSPTYFNKCFHEYFGYPPGKLINAHLERTESEIETAIAVKEEQPASVGKSNFHSLPKLILFAFISVAVIFAVYRKFHIPEWTDDLISSGGRISIAVMPFYNMTNDTTWIIWQEGIQECLITSLSNNKELKVRNKESVNALLQTRGLAGYAALSPIIAGSIARKLEAKVFVYGSIKKAGSKIRIDVQLADEKSEEVIKSFEAERPFKEENVYAIIDTISAELKSFLLITKIGKEYQVYKHYAAPSTKSPEAFRYYIYGNQAAEKFENARAISWYLKALEADSNYFGPMMGLSSVYSREGNMEKNYEWVLRYYKKRDQFSFEDQLWASWAYAINFESPETTVNYLKQIQQLDDQQPITYYLLGIMYNIMGQYDKTITVMEKNMAICRKWGIDFMKNNSMYTELGFAYHKTGQFRKEKRLYTLGEKYIPDDGPISFSQAILAFAERDTATARHYIEKFIFVHKNRYQSSEAHIDRRIAELYERAGMLNKAEAYFRKSLSLEPDNPERMFFLANFFNENNRNLDEVPGLMDKALTLATSNYNYCNYLDTKGWG